MKRKYVFARTVYADNLEAAITDVLTEIDDKGLDKAFQIKEATSLRSINDAVAYASTTLAPERQEVMLVIGLDHELKVIYHREAARGTDSRLILSPRDIFRGMLDKGIHYIVLAHNHLTNNVRPSPQDIHLTNRVNEMAPQLDMELMDHIIIGPDGQHTTVFNTPEEAANVRVID